MVVGSEKHLLVCEAQWERLAPVGGGNKDIITQSRICSFSNSFVENIGKKMFNISGEDITELRDNDLRELIGLLCEAEYRMAGLRTAGITWGGNQDAGDGGFDVVINDTISPPANCNIPHCNTGVQVKKPSMTPAEIISEMKPNGILRDSIKRLIEQGGSYIIVSSKASTTYSALEKRRTAMRAAVSDIAGNENLHLDFYDRGRIATWVRSYPAMILWVKMKIGRSLQGWQPYDNWSPSSQGTMDDYLVDDNLTLHIGATHNEGITTSKAIEYLREKLAQSRTFLRLVGLSGVGKTRFVQAVFDARIGTNHLSNSLVIYTNLSDNPMPDPITCANTLIAERAPAIMIVDNCPPDLHRRLVQVCNVPYSLVNILSVEYDVRDDLPEETEVLRLEPASNELIRQLITRSLPHISKVDAETIADFAGGNFRVAFALAGTIEQGETLGRLRNETLFKRLFNQTKIHDDSLLSSAQALSLVYSFEGTDIDSASSEIRVISELIERTPLDLFRNISELRDRQLVQSRSVWRAILPHAIANRLAQQALSAIPINRIVSAFMQSGQERLLRSFTRRLCFLHDNPEAKGIAIQWLAKDGWLGKTLGTLNELEFETFKNVSPVVPDVVLSVLEYWARKSNNFNRNYRFNEFISILYKIAYDPVLFSRCATLICQIALDQTDENYRKIKDTLKGLFYVYLSGTLAPPEMRVQVIDVLWNMHNDKAQDLALELLDAAYEVRHFSAVQGFNFGARPRDYGWYPKNRAEQIIWYSSFIQLGMRLALSNSFKALKVKSLIANNFRGLWTEAEMHSELEHVCDQLTKAESWNEGWAYVRETLHYASDENDAEAMAHLKRVEKKLRPNSLLEMVRTYVLSDLPVADILACIEEDVLNTNENKFEAIIERLGQKVAKDENVLTAILSDLVTVGSDRTWHFGRGLAESVCDKMELWRKIRLAYEGMNKEQIQVSCLMGILSSVSMDEIREDIMDILVNDPMLDSNFPKIQMASIITPQALNRLYVALKMGIAPIATFKSIAWGRAHEALSDAELVPYLKKIKEREGGIIVVLEIINMRLIQNDRQHSEEMLSLMEEVLLSFPYETCNRQQHNFDHTLAKLVNKCLRGANSNDAAKNLCLRLAIVMKADFVYDSRFHHILEKLAELQPAAYLDVFFTPRIKTENGINGIDSYFKYANNSLKKIRDEDILKWCSQDSEYRFVLIVSAIPIFYFSSEDKSLEWNPLVFKIIDLAPNASEILEVIKLSILPRSWSGSKAKIVLQRAEVLIKLFHHQNDVVVAWAKDKYTWALQLAEKFRRDEEDENRAQGETFE